MMRGAAGLLTVIATAWFLAGVGSLWSRLASDGDHRHQVDAAVASLRAEGAAELARLQASALKTTQDQEAAVASARAKLTEAEARLAEAVAEIDAEIEAKRVEVEAGDTSERVLDALNARRARAGRRPLAAVERAQEALSEAEDARTAKVAAAQVQIGDAAKQNLDDVHALRQRMGNDRAAPQPILGPFIASGAGGVLGLLGFLLLVLTRQRETNDPLIEDTDQTERSLVSQAPPSDED